MKIIEIEANNPSGKQIRTIIDYFNRGKVVVYPTDTVYGLGCLATDSQAIGRVRRIKRSNSNKPLLILVSSLAMAKKYCKISKKHAEYLSQVWPGPVTAVLPDRGNLPAELTNGRDNIAVRLPKNDFLCKIISRLGKPVISTSLNITGSAIITDLTDVEYIFKGAEPDLLVNCGKQKRVRPSRLIDIRDINNIKIIRS